MDIIFQVMDTVLLGLSKSYGLDWLTMFFGVTGAYFITKKDIKGIYFNLLSCCSSFALATICHQYGFVIYNLIFAVMMARAYASWSADDRERVTAKTTS